MYVSPVPPPLLKDCLTFTVNDLGKHNYEYWYKDSLPSYTCDAVFINTNSLTF